MADNFDFLKKTDKELYDIILDAQRLFRDEYFNQSVIQVRIFAEKMASRIIKKTDEMTFDDLLNCLKDKVKDQREKEFVDDLFFIKQKGNQCAHGEITSASDTLEVIQRAFEASINYVYSKTKDEKVNSLLFDTTLLITQKKENTRTLEEKYMQEAEKQELLNSKQGDFISQVPKKGLVKNTKKYKKQKDPKKEKIKQKIKEARKNLRQNVNKVNKSNKTSQSKKDNKLPIKQILFAFWVLISLILILKMLLAY